MRNSDLIILKNNEFLINQRVAGKCVATCLKYAEDIINSHIHNLTAKQIELGCVDIISKMNCTPTFFNYKGFPGKICASINNQIVHGIPSDYILQDGDVVKIDLGATYKGAIADAAITVIYGKPKSLVHVELLKVCKDSLNTGIKAIKVGNQLGCIGFAINKFVTNKSRFGLITDYGGHGICMTNDGQGIPHASPFVSNKSKSNEGIRIQPGLVIAVEPMCVVGSNETYVAKDNWTVIGTGISSHYEHSVYVHENSVEILTSLENYAN